MAGFAKFDPRAFLESEKTVTDHAGAQQIAQHTTPSASETLATLATLAAPTSARDNPDALQSSAIDNHLRQDSPKSGLSAAKVAKAAKVKSSVAAEATWGEDEEERAAIAEHDGGAPRVWAEALARLDPARAPGDVSPKRWLRFIDDCGRFLDEGWAKRADALGWGPLDLFGCDRVKPIARLDRAGLLWLTDGRKLLALTADTAAIATASGGSLTFRRCLNEPGRSLAWELQA
ncbi:hypothetical protein [Bradyrhizobium sp. OAE829]|uniref:hypothetical protein n=1 Tax=Bradyrhizobium sp. OAE829 TaxID=2663807 RepID=UPI0017894E78